VFELLIAIRVILSFSGLPVGLKRVTEFFENLGDLRTTDLVALPNQLALQVRQAFACPSKWRLRITTLGRLDQTFNSLLQVLAMMFQWFTTTAKFSLPTSADRYRFVDFLNAVLDGAIGQSRCHRNRHNTAPPQCYRFGCRPTTSTPLVEIIDQRTILQSESFDDACIPHRGTVAK
jgi:hypothetical protein